MNNALQAHLDILIASGKTFQVVLRGSAQPIGPAKVEAITVTLVDQSTEQLYRMMCPAMIQQNKTSQPVPVILPMVFAAEDVLMIIEEPVNAEGDKLVVTPPGRTAGGLHIPGRG